MPPRSIPKYEPLLDAAHRAQRRQWRAVVAALRLPPAAWVLEVASGDGWSARRLSAALGPEGRVIALDVLPAYLKLARKRSAEADPPIEWVCGVAAQLPHADQSFDLTWCAHSLVSLPDACDTLKEMRRVTRRGGRVAILENDSLHNVLLPWPVDLELAIRQAELAAFRQQFPRGSTPYVSRSLHTHFERAGLQRCQRRTFVEDLTAPLEPDAAEFLDRYLVALKERTKPHLSDRDAQRFAAVCDACSDEYLMATPGAAITLIETLTWAVC